jgi:hypothetical protein
MGYHGVAVRTRCLNFTAQLQIVTKRNSSRLRKSLQMKFPSSLLSHLTLRKPFFQQQQQ